MFLYKTDYEPKLTGHERYPIIGDFVPEIHIYRLIKKLKNLNRYWNCEEKARIAQEYLNYGEIKYGEMFIVDKDLTSYGFAWNPPYEFHAWLQLDNKNIFDIALPGVIELAKTYKDQHGHFLSNTQPAILNGEPPDWIDYRAKTNVTYAPIERFHRR